MNRLATPTQELLADDMVRTFRIGATRVLGRHVRLGAALDTVMRQHDYLDSLSGLLGELMALSVVLSHSIKYDGRFTVQTKGDGPVRMMVADISSAGAIRGYADISGEIPIMAELGDAPVPRLLGAGYLAFTVDQGPDTERYQGIVPLEGPTLSACAHDYFRRSEQIETGIVLACGRVDGAWRASALMLQRLPEGRDLPSGEEAQPLGDAAFTDEEEEDDLWRRSMILMSSVKTDELLDPALNSDRLLFRLFGAESVWAYPPRGLAFGCPCSRARAAGMLRGLPRGEVEQLKLDGQVEVTCQFCNRTQSFDDAALDALYAA